MARRSPIPEEGEPWPSRRDSRDGEGPPGPVNPRKQSGTQPRVDPDRHGARALEAPPPPSDEKLACMREYLVRLTSSPEWKKEEQQEQQRGKVQLQQAKADQPQASVPAPALTYSPLDDYPLDGNVIVLPDTSTMPDPVITSSSAESDNIRFPNAEQSAILHGSDIGKIQKLLRSGDLRGCRLPKFPHEAWSLRDPTLCPLIGARLDRCIFSGDLTGAFLTSASLRNAQFKSVILNGACLNFVKCAGASFEDADLIDARFHYAELIEASLIHAICMRAQFNHAHLTSTKAQGANLSYAVFADACIDRLQVNGKTKCTIGILEAQGRTIPSYIWKAVLAHTFHRLDNFSSETSPPQKPVDIDQADAAPGSVPKDPKTQRSF